MAARASSCRTTTSTSPCAGLRDVLHHGVLRPEHAQYGLRQPARFPIKNGQLSGYTTHLRFHPARRDRTEWRSRPTKIQLSIFAVTVITLSVIYTHLPARHVRHGTYGVSDFVAGDNVTYRGVAVGRVVGGAKSQWRYRAITVPPFRRTSPPPYAALRPSVSKDDLAPPDNPSSTKLGTRLPDPAATTRIGKTSPTHVPVETFRRLHNHCGRCTRRSSHQRRRSELARLIEPGLLVTRPTPTIHRFRS